MCVRACEGAHGDVCGPDTPKRCLRLRSSCVYVAILFSDMITLLKTPVGRVRLVGAVEGISYLLLLGGAMPLKYMADMPQAVRIVGMLHGLLFVAFCLTLLLAWVGENLSFRWSAIALIASLIPFGPFLIDKTLAKFDQI